MSEIVLCPLCNSSDLINIETISAAELNKAYLKQLKIKDAVSVSNFHYYCCQNCDLRFFYPLFDGDEALYENLQQYDWYYMDNKWEYDHALKFVNNSMKLLEVGAGKAAFARKVDKSNYTGLEFNDKAIESANKDGIKLLKQDVNVHCERGNKYDAVVTFQVLEHVLNPSEFIKGCINCLDQGGILVVGVPAKDGFLSKSVNNILDMPPHHLTHWTSKSLQMLGKLNNLTVMSLEYEPVASYHKRWARSEVVESKLRSILGMSSHLLDYSKRGILIKKIARLLALFLPFDVDSLRGHTIVAVYKK